MKNEQKKKLISIILIVAMVFANNGISVLAESMDETIATARSEKKETPNYYYEESFDDVIYEEEIVEQEIVEEYETYLEENNPGVFDDEINEEENVSEPEEEEEVVENEVNEEEIEEEINERQKEEQDENEEKEKESTVEKQEDISEEERKEESTNEEQKDQEIEKEVESEEEASESEIQEEIETSEEIEGKEGKEEKEEKEETKETEKKEEVFEEEIVSSDSESKSNKEENATESEIKENAIEKDIATISESEKEIEATESEIKNVKTSSESETEKDFIATNSEIEIATESEINIATESEVDVATESEVKSATASEIEASKSEIVKEKLVATVSKTSWKVKRILIATYSTTYVRASETEADRIARFATCANVVLVDEEGNEKLISVPLKWKLEKRISVDAHTPRNEKPVSVEIWRKKYEINKTIEKQKKEIVVATEAFSDFVEKIKSEHENEIEKEIVIVEADSGSKENETPIEEVDKDKQDQNETKEQEETEEKEITNETEKTEKTEGTEEIESIKETEETEKAEETERADEIKETEEDETADTIDLIGEVKESAEEEIVVPVEEENEEEKDIITEPTVVDFASTDAASDSETEVETEEETEEIEKDNDAEEASDSEVKEEIDDTDDFELIDDTEEETSLEEATNSEIVQEATKSEVDQEATKSVIASIAELKEKSGIENKMTLNDYQLGYMEVESIDLYKVDIEELSRAIADAINKEDKENVETAMRKAKEKDTKDGKGFLESLFGLFGKAQSKENVKNIEEEKNKTDEKIEKEEKTPEQELLEALKNANVSVVEESEVSSIIAEADAMRYGDGASHTRHYIKDQLKDAKIVTLGGEGAVPINDPLTEDLSIYSKEKDLSGAYYLLGDLELKIRINAKEDLYICTNGHSIKFATMGYIKASPGKKVVICNCQNDVSRLYTGEPVYGYKDRFYATTSETYTKYHEKPLIEADDIIVLGKHSLTTPNINFEGNIVKNQYVGKNAVDKMEADYQELDDPEISGDGSLLFAKHEIKVYGVDFKNNIATRTNGVAINAQKASLVLEKSNFIKNKNLSNVGGAIAINPRATQIYDCKFEENESETMGGAIYARAFYGAATESGTIIEKTTFNKNKARLEGGAMFFDYIAGEIKIGGSSTDKKVIFSNNEAGVVGGAIAFNHNKFTSFGSGGSSTNEYEKWPDLSDDRIVKIENVDFEENKAKSDVGNNENFGGAIYINNLHDLQNGSSLIKVPLIKDVKIKNVNFVKNIAEGNKVEIKEKVGGVYTGPVLAEYYVGNYGGAIYVKNINKNVGNGVGKVEIENTKFDENISMTGAGICAYNTLLDIKGGEIKNGKAKDDKYKNRELIEKIVTSGGGAIYLMDGAVATLSKTVSIKKNRNAFYLDGGSINIGKSIVEGNEGEYLIGYSNYTVHPGSRESGFEDVPFTNRILFSGVDIRNHTYYGAGKDYNASMSYVSSGETKNYHAKKQNTYVSFASANTIRDNRWVITEDSGYTKIEDYNYTEDTVKYRREICNIAMISSLSNLQIDLSNNSMLKSKTGMIGLYYYLASPDSMDDVITHTNWSYANSRVLREGGIWTNYFEVDQSQPGERLEGWKFYIKGSSILISPNIFTVKFDSFIEGVEEISEQHYNYKNNGQLVTITTPTEILYGSHMIPGKTFIGFLGRDKSIGAPASGSYVLWDFNKHRLQAVTGVEEVLILVYADDEIKLKACGCPSGTVCTHDDVTDQHIDRGTAISDTEEAHEKNYIIIATLPQFAYRYGGKKTQYILNKDMNITSAEAKEFLTGDMVLNLNGKTLTYNVEGDSDNYIFGGINPSYEYTTDNLHEPGNIFIVGNTTTSETEPLGKIKIKGKHNGSLINTSTRSIYINRVEFDGSDIVADEGNENSLFANIGDDTSIKINIENSTFENIILSESIISSISNITLKRVKTNKTKKIKTTGKPLITLGSVGIANGSELKLVDSTIEGIEADSFVSIKEKAKGTDIKLENVTINENKFDKEFINLDKDIFGNDTKLILKGKNIFNANEVLIGNNLLTVKAPLIFEASTSETKFDGNIVPVAGTNSIILLDDIVKVDGAMKLVNNKAVNTVYQTEKATVSVGDAEMYVSGNTTTYEWFMNNESTTKKMFERVAGSKFKASESVIEIRLKKNGIDKIIWKDWKDENLKTKKVIEEVFIRDLSYTESDKANIYKGGLGSDTTIYFGTGYFTGVYYLYPYKANEDERKTQSYDAEVKKINLQRIKNNTDTMFEGPRNISDPTKVIMWEGLAYVDSDGKIIDTGKEQIYPQDFDGIIVNENKDFAISGYRYRENIGRQHKHSGMPELWMEARNEGHLQASASYVFLHNDVEITHPLLNKIAGEYIICLNGHKLIIATNSEWIKGDDKVKINICDCHADTKGSIVIKSGINFTKDLIIATNGDIKIENVKVSSFENTTGRFLKTTGGRLQINGLEVNNVKADYSSINAEKSFIEVDKDTKATYSVIRLSNNTIKTNVSMSEKQSFMSINVNASEGKDVELPSFDMKENTIDNNGSIILVDGYKKVLISNAKISKNTVAGGSVVFIKGSGAGAILTINGSIFNANTKVYESGIRYNTANFDISGFDELNMDGSEISDTNYKNTTGTNHVYTALYLDDMKANIKNTTISNCNKVEGSVTEMYSIMIKGSKPVTFDKCIFKDIKNDLSGTEIIKVDTAYDNTLTFSGTNKFTNIKAKNIVNINSASGKVVFEGTKIEESEVSDVAINCDGNAEVIATDTIIKNIKGTSLNVNSDNVKLYNVEFTGTKGLTTKPAVNVAGGKTLVIGDKVKIEGYDINLKLSAAAKLTTEDSHKILKDSSIYVTTDAGEQEIFDAWSKKNIEKFEFYDNTHVSYFPSDLFKLDDAQKNVKVVYAGGGTTDANAKGKIYVNDKTSDTYATLIYRDDDVEKKGEITRQYIKAETETRVDRVKVPYLSTRSQMWSADLLHATDSMTAWKMTEYYTVNLAKGDIYNVYLVKKHTHKECGADAASPCEVHADGATHTTEFDFVAIAVDSDFRVAGRKNYGLQQNITISQASLDYLAGIATTEADPVIVCLHGHILTFEAGAKLSVANDIIFVNCEQKGYITAENDVTDILIDSTGGTLKFYNVEIKSINIDYPVVKKSDTNKLLFEKTTFSNITLTGDGATDGMIDFGTNKPYINILGFDGNIATGSTTNTSILKLTEGNFAMDRVKSVNVVNNKYRNELISIDGSYTIGLQSLSIKNNTMIGSSSTPFINGPLYVSAGSTLNVGSDFVIEGNDASINKESEGGAIVLYGKLNVNGDLILKNNKAAKGGAISVGNATKIVASKSYFIGNEAKLGAAIYGKTTNDAFNCDEIIFDANMAKEHGVVYWEGNLTLNNATFRNHASGCAELLYNAGSTDVLLLDKPIFKNNVTGKDAIHLDKTNSSTKISNITSDTRSNNFENFINIKEGNATLENIVLTNNRFNNAVINISTASGVVSISDAEIKENMGNGSINLENSILGVKGLEKIENIYISDDASYVRAIDKVSTLSEMAFTVYKDGTKVFEKWNASTFDYYDNPQTDVSDTRKYAYTPENSKIFTLNDEAINKKYEYYKVGDTNSQDIYLGSSKKFVKVTFYNNEEKPAITYVTQNIAKGEKTRLDKVDTKECLINRQSWIASNNEISEIWTFKNYSASPIIASLSENMTIYYIKPHIHKACGCDIKLACSHEDLACDPTIDYDYKAVANQTDIENLDITSYNYVYLTKDINIVGTFNIPNELKGICLNGHKLTKTGDSNSLIKYTPQSANDIFSICDCKKQGEIEITGEKTQTSPVFELDNAGNVGHLAIYNIGISSVSIAAPIFKNNTGDVNSHIYTENLHMRDIKNIPVDGIIENGGVGTVYMATFSVARSTINENTLITLDENVKFGYIYLTEITSKEAIIKADNISLVSIKGIHANKNDILNGALIHATNSDIEISKEVSMSNNKTKDAVFNLNSNTIVNIGGVAVFMENENLDGNGGVINMESSRFSIASVSVFSDNKAKNGAAIYARNLKEYSGRSELMIDNAVFMSNEVVGGHGVINYSGLFDSEDVLFINHLPIASELIYAGEDCDNTIKINKITFAGNTLVDSSSKYDAIYIKNASKSFITDIKKENLTNNKFNNFIKLENGDIELSDINITESNNTFADTIFTIKGAKNVSIYNDFVIENQDVTKAAIILENSKIVLGNNKSTKKTKVIVKGNGSGKNIVLSDSNSYFKGADLTSTDDNISTLSEMYIKPLANGIMVYDGWNDKNIEGYNHLVSTETPIKYMYTPEMSGIFKADGVSGYKVYKKGTESICMGDNTQYVVLTFKKEPDYDNDEDETARKIYGTQNIASGADTKLDLVDMYDYELKKQEWIVPGLVSRWRFADDAGNIKDVIANETSSKDITLLNKHLHKICGDKLTVPCIHTGIGTSHTETIDYYYVATTGDLLTVPVDAFGDKYIALKADLVIPMSGLVSLNQFKGICLNGHTITYSVYVDPDPDYEQTHYNSLINLSGSMEMSVCDCKYDRAKHGYMTLYETGSGKNYKNGAYINVGGNSKLNLYNMHFATMSYTTYAQNFGTIRYYDGCLAYAADVNSRVYMDNPVFENIQVNGEYGLFGGRNYSTTENSKGMVILDSPLFSHTNSGSSDNPIIKLNDKIKISTLSMINNKTQGYLLDVVGDRSLSEVTIRENNSTAKSIIHIADGNTLTFTGKNVFTNNTGYRGGVFFIEGKLVANDELVFKNNTGNLSGGAIQMENNGKIEAHATVSFIGNEGNGAAIYARNIDSDALNFTKVIFDNNKSIGAIIDFTGKLKLSNAEFRNHKSNASEINILIQNGSLAGTDEIDLSNIKFINNDIVDASAIILEKVAAGSRIHDIDTKDSSSNKFKNFIDIQNGSVVTLDNLTIEGIKCTENVIKIDSSNATEISTISITKNDAVAGLAISNGSVFIKNKIIINENKDKNIYLADVNAYLKGRNTLTSYLDKDSVLSVTTALPNQKVYYGWNKYNIEKYDNPDKKKRPMEYMYTPENSGIFVKGKGVANNYKFYKVGDTDDQDVYLGDDFITLTFYNDHESLDEPITYGTQNIKKNSLVKLDKVDSFEYELRKQDWKAPNPPSADITWNFANPVTGVEQDVKANYGDNQVIKYVQKHIHKLCGKTLLYDCDHTDTSAPIHATTAEYIEIGQADVDNGFASIAADVEYLTIKEDVIVNGTLVFPAQIKGFCLNGHIVKSYGSVDALIDIAAGKEFNICNCRNNKNKGYITVDGTQTGDLIKANGTKLRIYSTAFKGINTTKALVSANSGDTYLEDVKFTELKGTGNRGILANVGAGTYTIANLIIDNNQLETLTPLLTINNSMNISTISVTNNKTKASTIKFDATSINFGSLMVKGNETTGNGTIYVPSGTTLTLDKDIEFVDNKANNGGAFYVEGNLIANKETTFIHNTATEKGGAIYIAAGGKVTIDGDTLFERNSAKNGSAIYATNLATDDLKINKEAIFRNENVTADGIVSWQGELSLSSPSFIGNTGTCGSLLANAGGSGDKLTLVGAKFINNNIPTKDAIKLTQIGEANIKNLYIQKGSTVNKFANAMNIIGGTVKFTEDLNISENTLGNAGIRMTGNANVIFNGNVKVEKNTSVNGAIYIGNGSNVEIQGRSFKINSNTATGNYGAAITLDRPANVNTQIETFEVTDNKSAKGGAIYVNGVMGIAGTTRAYVYGNKLTNNKAKNIFIANNTSYIKATDIINANSKLGFSAAGNNYKVFETWDKINFTKIDDPSGDYSYTPENSGIFALDDESKTSKYEFYKSGIGENVVIKLGKNYVTLTFENANKSTKYSIQKVEKNVLTKVDVVKADATRFASEKWIYPGMGTSKAFIDGDVNVKYAANQEIIKSFKYKIVYTAGSKASEVISGNISSEIYEYGEEFTIRNSTYVLSSPSIFIKWNLRAPISGIKASYKAGDIAKNICTTENGIAYLDAMWDDEHAVRFYPNGEVAGKVIDSDPSFTMIKKKGSKITIAETYEQSLIDNYTYSTYNTKPDGSGKTYNFGDEITIGEEDVDLYCIWQKVLKKYTVTFDTAGGSTISSQKVLQGNKVVKPIDPVKKGYKFLGWYKTSTGKEKYNFNTAVKSSFTLYAHWKAEYTVKFDTDGGSAISSQKILEGGRVTVPDDPEKKGYRFIGWYKTKTGNESYYFDEQVLCSFTIYAKWEKISSGGGGGGASGAGSGFHNSGGYIIDGVFIPYGPALEILPEYVKPTGYYVDEVGFIRDMESTIVGNTLLGDRINEDGTFTDSIGYTHRLDGTIIDVYGNVRNLDGSITTYEGFTYYLDGSIRDKDGLVYRTDGSIEYPDGSIKDSFGLMHRVDGSIVTADGITYYVDGSIEYPDGTKVLPDGVVMKNNIVQKTDGSWEYDPITNGWKFFVQDKAGSRTYYKDEWVATENKNGEVSWFIIDTYGNMVTGWVKADGDFYYMSQAEENRGELVRGEQFIAGRLYKLDPNTGKLLDNFEPDDYCVLGAVNHKSGIDGEWKNTEKGRMFIKRNVRVDGKVTEEFVKGWFMVDGHYYLFNEDGIARTGLIISDGKYYYLEEDGKMLEGGERVVDGVTYVFDKATGACRSSRVDKENIL